MVVRLKKERVQVDVQEDRKDPAIGDYMGRFLKFDVLIEREKEDHYGFS